MSKFTPFPYIMDSSMMSLFSQSILMLIDLQVYSLWFMYVNLTTF